MASPITGHTRPQLYSGARGQLKINGGTAIAFITDVTINVQANVRAVHTFGAANARSIEPLSYGASVTIGRVIPINRTDGTPVNTSDVQLGIEPIITQMLAAEDITVSLYDSISGVLVSEVRNCRFAGRSLNLSSQQIAQERIQLVGIFDAKDNTSEAIGLS